MRSKGNNPYGAAYRKAKAVIMATRPRCHICGAYGSDSPDHVPSLHEHRHIEGSGCCVLKPTHLRCNMRRGGWRAATRVREIRRRSR